MIVPESKRYEYWNHFVAQWAVCGTVGRNITKTKLRKAMPRIMDDDGFWWDIVLRHGGDKVTPEEMAESDPRVYEHCQGNFWGGVYQDLTEMGLM